MRYMHIAEATCSKGSRALLNAEVDGGVGSGVGKIGIDNGGRVCGLRLSLGLAFVIGAP